MERPNGFLGVIQSIHRGQDLDVRGEFTLEVLNPQWEHCCGGRAMASSHGCMIVVICTAEPMSHPAPLRGLTVARPDSKLLHCNPRSLAIVLGRTILVNSA